MESAGHHAWGPRMQTAMPGDGRSRTTRVAITLALAVLVVPFVVLVIRAALFKSYSLDEFQYGHAAWLISEGWVPYRDFFEFHFPLLYQYLAIPFVFLDDAPGNIGVLRVAMLPILAVTTVSGWFIVSRRHALGALLVASLILSNSIVARFATEIRPDALAIALMTAALAVLYSGMSPVRRGLASGLLLGLAIWASQKVLYFGSPFAAALVVDLVGNRRQRRACLLGHPGAFLAGSLIVLAAVALYLSVTRSWTPWFQWCLQWSLSHERQYPGFSWTESFDTLIHAQPWPFVFAAAGLVDACLRLVRERQAALSNPDVLLVACLLASVGTLLVTTAPFPYTLLPFCVLLSILAARGVLAIAGSLASLPRKPGLVLLLALALVVAGSLWQSARRLSELIGAPGNEYQRDVLAQLDELTAADDPVYDNSGGFVTRPHVHYLFYTNALMRRTMTEHLEREIPAAIRRTGCTVMLRDLREDTLPDVLKEFLAENFQPYNADIHLWGRRYEPGPGGELAGQFFAPRTGTYFVEPESALDGAVLRVDGVAVEGPLVSLTEGARQLHYEGPAESFYLLWLPADGRRYAPQARGERRFSRQF